MTSLHATDMVIQIGILAAFLGILFGYWFGRIVLNSEHKDRLMRIQYLEKLIDQTEDEKRILEKELEKVMP